MGDIIIITGEVVIEVKVMIGIGVGHTRDKIETEERIEVLVILGQDQVQGKIQIEIGSDVLNAGNMITSQGNAWLGKQVGKLSKYNRCSIWMKTGLYYMHHWWTQI